MRLLIVLLHVSIFVCSMTDTRTETRQVGHIVIITSPFFGHIIPLLDFARRLSVDHHVTYVMSATKLDALKQRGFLDESSDVSLSRLEMIGLLDDNNEDIEVSLILQ